MVSMGMSVVMQGSFDNTSSWVRRLQKSESCFRCCGAEALVIFQPSVSRPTTLEWDDEQAREACMLRAEIVHLGNV